MKKNIIFFLMLCLPNIIKAQITVSSPFDKAVYQRSSAGNATVTIAGQFPNAPCSPNSYVRYRILNISLSNGATISTYVNYTIATTDARGRFFFTITPNIGWYQIEFQAYINNVFVTSNTTKFGVGDVFIIAGQSNAQSISQSDSPNQSPTTVQAADVTYEAVVSNNYNESCQMGNGKMPRFPFFSTLASGTGVGALGNAIAPTGFNNWCYTRLGNQLAAAGIPVAFFNAAAGGSSIRAWYNSKNGGGQFCFVTPLAGEPYATLKKTLNYYGSIFGVRAILWHQGESDNKNITNLKQSPDVTQNEYTYDLIALINQSRSDFNSQLSWVVSKTSWNEGLIDSRITDAQTDVLAGLNPSFIGSPSRSNNSALSPSPILGVVTDNYNNSYRIASIPGSKDEVHFNNSTSTTGLDGLRILGDQFKTKLPLSSGTPIVATPMQNLTVTKSGSTFTLIAPPSGYTGYFWVTNNNRLDNANPIYTGLSSVSISGGSHYRCYLRKSNGNIELTSSGFTNSVCAANREASTEDETDDVDLKTYPNPSADEFTIEFNVPFEADFAKVDLITMTGEVIKVVAQGSFAKGHFTYPMVGKELPSGTYICRLLINDTTYSTKLIKLGN